MLPLYCAADDLKTGALVQILKKYQVPERPIYALFPHSKLMPATTRTFIEFLVRWFKGASSPLKTTDDVLNRPSFAEAERGIHKCFARSPLLGSGSKGH